MLVERHEELSGEAFWDAGQHFLDRIDKHRDGVTVETPARYALLPAMIAAAHKHDDEDRA